MNEDLKSYYSDRAKEYDKVYSIPHEQQDLAEATAIFQKLFAEKTVLEIACGTGWWTKQISATATSIFATDFNEAVVEIAKGRNDADNVSFRVADMYTLNNETKYDALFGGFIWSHILLQDLEGFLQKLTGFLKPSGIIAFIDSKLVKDKYHDVKRIVKADEYGNTYQTRDLDNGTTHIVLKNFPAQEFLQQKLSKFYTDINYIELENYWIVTCKLK